MRAHKPIAKGKADAVSRARMLMKSRLWWLDGFAGEDGWTALPLDGSREVETVALDRTHLRRAALTINELQRDFPRALGRIAGDGARWAEAARQVVSLVKPWVHGGTRPPPDLFSTDLFSRAAREQAVALAAECPPLAPAVAALSWLLATRAQAAPRHVRFLARNREALARVVEPRDRDRIVLVLRLAHLGATAGESLVAPLVAVAADRRADSAPLRDANDLAGRTAVAIRSAARMIDRLPGDAIKPTLPGEIASWVAFLSSVDATIQRRFLRMLAALDLTDVIAAWSAWWAEHHKLMARLQTIEDGRDRLATADVLSRLRASFEQQVRRRPPAVQERKLGSALRTLSADACEPCAAPARAALARLPARPGLRAAFLVQWGSRAGNGAAIKLLAMWLGLLRDYLAATGATEEALSPLAGDARTEAERKRAAYCLLDELDSRPADHLKRVFAALASLHGRRPEAMSRELASRVDELACHVREPDRIADVAAALHDTGQTSSWLADEVVRSALALGGDDPAIFAAMAPAIREIHQSEAGLDAERLVGALVPAFADDQALLRELLVAGDRRMLIACGERLTALLAIGEPLPELAGQTGATAWIDEQPPRLHAALRLLAGSTADAEAIARRAIGAVWRSPASLEQERAAISRQMEGAAGEKRAKLEARRASLSRQIRDPSPPPERVQRRLEEKLRRRAALERLQALDRAARARLAHAAARHFGVAGEADWLVEQRSLCLLPAFAALPARDRALARQILRVRSGPQPWDLRDHASNQTFLRRLGSLDIDTGPWVDGIGVVERASPVGPLRLSLEDDPLEVFHMGGHFRTCLGPGGANFFSVLANAADINKRVLYARTAAGAVLGRRLLCLTGEGAILVFHAYCHDPSIDFEQMSGELVRELARRMRTRLAGRGQVPCLVASRWYDDGPDDITGQLAFLAEGSAFRRQLAVAAPEELPALLAAELGGDAIDALLAPMIAGLPELSTRPELVHALLPLIRDRAHLTEDAMRRLAGLLEAAGDAATAAELFGDALERGARLQFRTQAWVNIETIELLCRIDPGRGLRALRQTRPDGARSWRDEKHADRLVAAAGALERLRRPAQAARLLRQAAAASGPVEAVAAARRRLDELAA